MVPVAFSSSVATASCSAGPRSMPMYHVQLKSVAFRSLAPGAGVYRAGACCCADTAANDTNAMAIVRTVRIGFPVFRLGTQGLRDEGRVPVPQSPSPQVPI